MRNLIKILLFVLAVQLLSVTFPYSLRGSPSTTIYVYPSQSAVEVGQNFAIDIKISDVVDLYGWEFKLSWNPDLLYAVEVIEGDFLKQGGNTFFYPKINNTQGYILADCTLFGDVPGVNGDGTLAYVEFSAKGEGDSVLDLYDTKLVNSEEQSIPHTANDGSVTVSKSVGGVIIPVGKLELLAPWIGLTLTVILIITTLIVVAKRRKKQG